VNPLSPGDARWLAAVIDCAGSITINRQRRDGVPSVYFAQVSCASAYRSLIDEVVRLLGHGTVLDRPGTNRTIYYWQTSSRKAADVLAQVEPWLIGKRAQALVALELEARKPQRGKQHRLDVVELAERERLKLRMGQLNRGEAA
jgi:hypothetical protein